MTEHNLPDKDDALWLDTTYDEFKDYSLFKYITDHLLRAWVQQWTYNFKHWADLMTNNYEGYNLLEEDDPEQECYEWFWASINMDETLPKEFLESLYRMVHDIDIDKVNTYSLDDVLKLWREDDEQT